MCGFRVVPEIWIGQTHGPRKKQRPGVRSQSSQARPRARAFDTAEHSDRGGKWRGRVALGSNDNTNKQAMSDELRGAQAEDKEWELLGGEPGETSKPRSASELVESFWRKATGASGAEAAQSTRMSCEDVIERSEAALSSQILGGGAEESRASGEEGEGEGRLEEGEESRQNGNYRLFGPLRTRVESALAAVLYGFGANDSAQPNALADVLSSPNVAKLIENRYFLALQARTSATPNLHSSTGCVIAGLTLQLCILR